VPLSDKTNFQNVGKNQELFTMGFDEINIAAEGPPASWNESDCFCPFEASKILSRVS